MGGGPKGLSKADLVQAALAEIEERGLDAFTLRGVASRAGCDAMALIYHFKSKTGLERAVADLLNEEARAPNRNAPWRDRLHSCAVCYRKVALRHPHAFPLLLNFVTTGPADLASAEQWHGALHDAGFPDREVAVLCFGLYAAVIGLCLAETKGLLGQASVADRASWAAVDADLAPVTARIRSSMTKDRGGAAFNAMLQVLLDGLEQRAAKSNDR